MGRRRPGEGYAKVEARLVGGRSVLSRSVHASPLRVQPMPTASARRAKAAAAVIASVGGGLLADDDVQVEVSVGAGATLWLGTQASTKIYKKRRTPYWSGAAAAATRSRFEARVAGTLVYAPDPCVPYRGSAYAGTSRYVLEPGASLVTVDWVQAGRVRMRGGERWVLESFSSRATWQIGDDESAADAVVLDAHSRRGFDLGGTRRDATATLAVVGLPEVASRCLKAARAIARRSGARVVDEDEDEDFPSLASPVALGCSSAGKLLVARLVAADSEDIYRVLHHVLLPLEAALGSAPYADRIYGSSSRVSPRDCPDEDDFESPPLEEAGGSWGQWLGAALRLGDAALPTGGFAHSGGLEAASQLGVLRPGDEASLLAFVAAAADTHARLYAPFAKAAARDGADLASLDGALDALLKTHAPARRASERQGAAVRRIAESLGVALSPTPTHGAVAMGFLAATLGLPDLAAAVVFAHATTRDAFSAAVRLGLVGPLRAVALQARALDDQVRRLSAIFPDLDPATAATSAPLLDALHAAHDLLEMRLFQS
ncbi:hypothetical protein CTAYLR_001275 [Chrysophaeum taylorii]|uniref:Urease accessory protein n=1 Tax=Chrysophaeum taylorii TaxID=2483200 RepID=A0AAD7UCQ6_9STRA|nr:hypothetical protein CTAYLR_001275 [Chrysophaeum taylorii]